MHLRDRLVLSSLFVVTACPPSDSTTTDPGTSDGPPATTGSSGTDTVDAPTTDTTEPTSSTTDTPGTTTTSTTGTTDTTTDPTSTTGEPQLLVETCAQLHAEDPGAGDGEYTLYVGKDPNKPWTVYCHDMAGTPTDYLVLVNTADGRNFSQYTASNPEHMDVVTTFTRVRIDPLTLVVNIDDLTFSASSGMVLHGGPITSMPYGVAEGCAGLDIADGLANIDLVGTPFKVIDPFCTKGADAAGEAVFSSNDQIVDLTGGGNCGWTGPTKGDECVFDPQNKGSGFVLELAYMAAPPPEDIPGVWTGAFGTMVLKKVGDEVWGAYTHDEGTVVGTYADGLFVGWWCELPSRMPDADAGDVEFKFVDDGDVISLDGRWRYGTGGAWDENWDLTKSDELPPPDLEARFADMSAFCPKP